MDAERPQHGELAVPLPGGDGRVHHERDDGERQRGAEAEDEGALEGRAERGVAKPGAGPGAVGGDLAPAGVPGELADGRARAAARADAHHSRGVTLSPAAPSTEIRLWVRVGRSTRTPGGRPGTLGRAARCP